MTADAPAKVRRKNPYVGPRAFRADEALYGRERECRELTDLLIAERIVLVHSPSGAGKTSLIQSRVIPRLTREGFTVSPVLRVNTLSTKPVANRWVYSVVLGLVGEDGLDEWPGLENATIPDVLNRLDSQAPGTERVLVFDQFEEILRIEPTDWHGQTEFFEQLGAALVDGSRWALFSMREDFVGGLDRYVCYLPGHLRTWYRLDFLQRNAALRAIQKPAEDWGAKFTDEAAEQLFDDLARVDVEVPNRELEKSVGPYVEPVHLQVACHRLWRALKNERSPQPVKMITADDVTNFAEIDTTLAGFYSDAVTDVVAETHVDERTLRDWFEKELITVERWRSQTRRGPSCSPVDVATVLGALEDRYLIRSDRRAGVIWYELTHDRLINPVLRSNKDWRRTNLHWIQYRAYEWDRKGRDDTYLLPRDLLAEAQVWLLTHRNDSRDLDCQFINESRERNGQTILLRRLNRLSQLVILLIVVVIVEAAVILYLMPTT